MTKKALLVGINYVGQQGELNGCVNDIENVKFELEKAGYNPRNIMALSDVPIQGKTSASMPTKHKILVAMDWLMQGVQPGDELVFHYSGHGTQVRDTNGDEKDGADEAICPVNYMSEGFISDDEIRARMCEKVPEGASLLCIIDACHSGTASDLRLNCRRDGNRIVITKDKKYPNTKGKVVTVSGCRDDQTSADAYEAGEYQGAMTYSLLETFKWAEKNGVTLTYKKLIKRMQDFLKARKYTQVPQLSFGNWVPLNSVFKL